MTRKIVVLGAGYAGILTAKKLAKKLKKHDDIEITIIDRNSFHTMLTELHEVAAWRVEEDSIRIDLKKVFAGRNVNVVLDHIVETDYENRVLRGENGTYEFDFLVLASGSKPTFFGVPGAAKHSFTLWSYQDAVVLRDHIMDRFRRASSEPDAQQRRRLLSFCIVGAGFTGVEMAGELAELAPILCRRFHIDRSEVTILNMDVLERMVPILPEKLSEKTRRRLEKMGVRVMMGCNVCGVEEGFIEYAVKAEGEGAPVRRETAGTVIWTAGIEGSELAQASTELELVGRGRIQTDQYLRSTKYENIFIGGDNIFYIPDGKETPVPQMVENCEACADTIAHNLTHLLTGDGGMEGLEAYKPKFHGVMVSIGGRYGVAHVGTAKTMFSLPSFLAMFCKHFINVLYFVQVLGWNKIHSYIWHEFFTIRHCRSFVGGHLSNRTPSFMLMPLRVFLGFYWVWEGWQKIQEGWFRYPMLTGFFQGANDFYDSILHRASAAFDVTSAPNLNAAAAAVVDAVSSSTGEAWTAVSGGPIIAELANPVILNWKILGFIRVLLVNSGDIALKVQVTPIDWFLNKVILPSDGLQMFFQVAIVLAEILIGLALIAGLFNFLASGASLALQAMFLTSTGLYLSSWWMVFAGIAVLLRGGRTLGLDYWVMPSLTGWWKNRKFVRKWYLYHD